jgi:hypothetical protein
LLRLITDIKSTQESLMHPGNDAPVWSTAPLGIECRFYNPCSPN